MGDLSLVNDARYLKHEHRSHSALHSTVAINDQPNDTCDNSLTAIYTSYVPFYRLY